MSEHLPDLPPDVARLLEAERDESLPSSEVARMRARLYAAIGGPSGGGGQDGGGSAELDGGSGPPTVDPGAGAASGSASTVAKAVLAGKSSLAALTFGLVVGGIGGMVGTLAWMGERPGEQGASHSANRTRREPASAVPERSAPSDEAAAEGRPPPAEPSPENVEAPAPETHERSAKPPDRSASEGAAPSRPKNTGGRAGPERAEGQRGSLARERRLVDAARTAVREGHHAEALAVLERHASAFPEGSLSEERSALEIRALLGLGRDDEARRSAARFRDRHPDSLFWPTLEARLSELE